MDTGTGLALLGSAELVRKLLGPTADYLGEGIKNWTVKGANNVKDIFSNATKKLGHRIELEGAVPPRVLKGILTEGPFCDDFIATEYFGGVLASSRSGISRDDRGASFVALISRLSSYQLRTHYVFYHIFKHLFNGTYINIGKAEGRDKTETYIPIDVYEHALELDEKEYEKKGLLTSHILFGLHQEDLLANFELAIEEDEIKKYFKSGGITKPGIIFLPSVRGVELFLWVYGKSDLPFKEFFNPMNQFEIDSRVIINSGYQKTKE